MVVFLHVQVVLEHHPVQQGVDSLEALNTLQPHIHGFVAVDILQLFDKVLYLPRLNEKEVALRLPFVKSYADGTRPAACRLVLHLNASEAQQHQGTAFY